MTKIRTICFPLFLIHGRKREISRLSFWYCFQSTFDVLFCLGEMFELVANIRCNCYQALVNVINNLWCLFQLHGKLFDFDRKVFVAQLNAIGIHELFKLILFSLIRILVPYRNGSQSANGWNGVRERMYAAERWKLRTVRSFPVVGVIILEMHSFYIPSPKIQNRSICFFFPANFRRNGKDSEIIQLNIDRHLIYQPFSHVANSYVRLHDPLCVRAFSPISLFVVSSCGYSILLYSFVQFVID